VVRHPSSTSPQPVAVVDAMTAAYSQQDERSCPWLITTAMRPASFASCPGW
jgi:hypothetical protein